MASSHPSPRPNVFVELPRRIAAARVSWAGADDDNIVSFTSRAGASAVKLFAAGPRAARRLSLNSPQQFSFLSGEFGFGENALRMQAG